MEESDLSDQREGGIGWTDQTWNPVRGCSRISPGCEHCYAETMAGRFCGKGQPYEGLVRIKDIRPNAVRFERNPRREARWTGVVRLVPDHLADPLRWKRPRRVFVNSMSDLFHERLSNEEIAAVFGVMAASPKHTFQVLTKRAARMKEWFAWLDATATGESSWRCADYCQIAAMKAGVSERLMLHEIKGTLKCWNWPLPNVWLGVSVEDQRRAEERIPLLLKTPAAVRFVSAEPLLGPVDLSPWMGGTRVQQDQEGRGVRLRGGEVRRAGDRRPGPNLASGQAATGSMGRAAGLAPMHADDRGQSRDGRVPERASNDRRQANDGAVSSAGLVPLQRADPDGDDHQPQERDQGRQPAEQHGNCLGLRAADPREPGSRDGTRGESDGGTQSVRESDRRAGNRDSGSAGERRNMLGDRGPLRDHLPAGVADRARPQSLSWIISGCESGPGARPTHPDWYRALRDQCAAASVPFFLKQARPAPGINDGPGSTTKAGGVIAAPYLDGRQWLEFPDRSPAVRRADPEKAKGSAT